MNTQANKYSREIALLKAQLVQCTTAMREVSTTMLDEVERWKNLDVNSVQRFAAHLNAARATPVHSNDEVCESCDWVDDVLNFHRTFDQPIGQTPHVFGAEHPLTLFRLRLLDEERHELTDALKLEDTNETADAIADMIYVLVGTAISFGIDLRPVWSEVHRSNMAKVGGGNHADGKIKKPEGWHPPDIAKALELGSL